MRATFDTLLVGNHFEDNFFYFSKMLGGCLFGGYASCTPTYVTKSVLVNFIQKKNHGSFILGKKGVAEG